MDYSGRGRVLTAGVGPQARAALTCFCQHGCQELAHNGAPLPHLALLAVGEVGDDANDVPGTGGLQCIRHDQQLHHSRVHVSETGGLSFGINVIY